MNKTTHEAVEFAEALNDAVSIEEIEATIVLFPAFTALSEIKKNLEKSPVFMGAQDLFWEEKGAFTGEISASMLKDAGCDYVLIGHSERRKYFGESNESVNKKIRKALTHNLSPVMCIGESLEERKKGETIKKIETQLKDGLNGLGKDEIKRIILAYEPIWAIGTGETATPAQAEEVHHFIRNKLAENYGNENTSCVIILYGGSVKPANTFSLLKEKDINGVLVGGASLKVDSFKEIITEAIKAYKER